MFCIVQNIIINIREIGYLTDSKKVTITNIPRPMEQIYGNFFGKIQKSDLQEPPKFKQFVLPKFGATAL